MRLAAISGVASGSTSLELIEHISQAIALEPGDVIATGTPSGVTAEADDPVFVSAGDLVEVEIEGLGRLRNPVLAA